MWLLIALCISVVSMAVIGVLAFSDGSNTGTYYGHQMMNGGWGWGMAGLMVIPGILLVVIIIVALGGASNRPSYNAYPCGAYPYAQPQSPMDILNQRFARGEIGQEEYQRVKDQLVR